MTEAEFFPSVTLYPRGTVGMFPFPDDIALYVRITYAADVEPGDVVLGDAQKGYRFDGYLCTPYLAQPAEHDQGTCWECRHDMANYRPKKPGPGATPWAVEHYGHVLESVEGARRHHDGAVIDLTPGATAHVCDVIVIVPAAFAQDVPAVADYQQRIKEAHEGTPSA